ncbi:hypothetical protein KKB64_00530 [Patescibacteria group bacterium]|nr:hypothetical protein [Patescibacteria group bacterium]MBU1472259.1 hypothetical protein [Patescibacteria group bacterium]MBU2460490.1 hypothetical protein [Patescibacteria group bacterium]MBU2544025.1 hypothetical protein [Patescibacteria group bacterium]
MPRKTRRQKLSAEHHRSSAPQPQSPQATSTHIDSNSSNNLHAVSYRFNASTLPKTESQRATTPVSGFDAIKRDLVKTLIISVLMIVSEFMVSRIVV